VADIQLTGVSKTLVFTLRVRAEEHARPDALFHDEHAVRWLHELPRDEHLERTYSPFFQTGIALRTYRFDEIAREFIASHPRPVVVELAAGLSSRYYRAGEGKARWVELDLPDVIAVRRRLDAESEEHKFVAASVLHPAWMDQVPATPPENLLLLTEGLLMYLDRGQVEHLARQLRGRFAGATWAFDVFGHAFSRRIADSFAAAGAPFQWSVTNEQDVVPLGLRLVGVWRNFTFSARRWGWRRWLSWLPRVRNSHLVLETVLQPLESS
jgi:O-methyltransferase involved in polyketide biosynthesis